MNNAHPCHSMSDSNEGETRDVCVQRLQRENHLLRLQLLKLRDKQRQLMSGHSADAPAAGLSQHRLPQPWSTSEHFRSAPCGVNDLSTEKALSSAALDHADEAANELRARALKRQEERRRRAVGWNAPKHGAVGLSTTAEKVTDAPSAAAYLLAVSPSPSLDSTAAQLPATLSTSPTSTSLNNSAAPLLSSSARQAAVAENRAALPGTTAQTATSPLPETAARDDDMSAQAMLQRFQNRKAQRRLRLEQMLGSTYESSGNADNGAVGTTPLGKLPRGNCDAAATQPHYDGVRSHANSNNSSTVGGVVSESEPGWKDTTLHSGASPVNIRGGQNWDSATAAPASASTTAAASAPAAPTGPTQNPNQIGCVVTDAVRNNSWYLCKVLESALLDTIQARHVSSASARSQPPASTALPSGMTSFFSPTSSLARKDGVTGPGQPSSDDDTSSFCTSASSLCNTHAEYRRSATAKATTTGTSRTPQLVPIATPAVSAPQLLFQEGVSDTALRRAIEESLVLNYRCVRDAPRRLTTQQAADDAVPPFEAENRDAELRRCFARHGGKETANRGSCTEDGSAVASDDDNAGSGGGGGTEDDNLDPFARLLLARISAELPVSSGKGGKKPKCGSGNNGAREEALQGHGRGSFDEALWSSSLSMEKSGGPSLSGSKASTAFVMAAAGGDGRVHIPKRHFTRLDEAQVEMHAPVIFNQIRGFLRLDVDRFRRSFARSTPGFDGADGMAGGASDGARPRGSPQPQRLARLGGGPGGADEATAWRISVSPGKSGTTLLYFGDYVMKTVRPSEMDFFVRKFLPAYVRYCERNHHTLLPRFYALVTVRWWKAGVAQHFVLMHNVFATPYYINRIYDVKGSTVNRTALQPGKPPPRTAFGALLLKDNDLPPQLILCGPYQRAILLAQFRSDVGFLRQLSIVDYSCMIGVRSRLFSREEGPSKTIVLQRRQHHDADPHVDPLSDEEVSAALGRHGRTHSDVTNVTSGAAEAGKQMVGVGIPSNGAGTAVTTGQDGRLASEDDVYVCIHGCDGGLLSLPIYAPGDDTTAREDVYYLGIIDVLQTYNSAKKLESFAKGFVNDRQAISVIPPEGYAERLHKVLERITV